MLKLEGVKKNYSKNTIIEDATIEFLPGELYIIQGENGCGKSTLLKIISGIIYKSDGDIYNDSKIAFLPDKFLIPKLIKAKTYLKTILDLYGKKELTDELMNKYKIPNKRMGDLSKGNLVKVGIIETIYNEKDVYIFDEPIDGLDDFAKHIFKEEIIKLLDNKKTVILALHTKSLFNELKPTILDMKNGFLIKKERRNKNEE